MSLRLTRARLNTRTLQLRALAPLDATGKATVSYRARVRGATRTVTARVPVRTGRLVTTLRIPRAARARSATLRISYPGDSRYLPVTITRAVRR